jgi:BirA family biotin operon repressor/biotin-[acetyl-CoA-carboxylase] ligase
VHAFAEIDSTSAELLRRAALGAPEGTVAVASTQTAGRVRNGRGWVDRPDASLLFSVLLRPRLTPAHSGLLPLAAGLAAATALQDRTAALGGGAIRLKWPNDIVIVDAEAETGYRKLGGILVERSGYVFVVGIGLNVNGQADDFPVDLQPHVGTLEAIWGRRTHPESLLRQMLARLEQAYQHLLRGRTADIVAAFAALDICCGRSVCVSGPAGDLTGPATGIAPDGGLQIEPTPGETVTLYAGDVSVRLR